MNLKMLSTLLPVAAGICLFFSPEHLVAQQPDDLPMTIRGDRDQIAPGTFKAVISFRSGSEAFVATQYSFRSSPVSVPPTVATATRGIFDSDELLSFSELKKSPVVISLMPAQDFLEVPNDDHGFLFLEGRIHLWPPSNPVVAIGARDNYTVHQPEEFSEAYILLSSGKTVSISGINVRPSQDNNDSVTILSGRTSLRSSVPSWFGEKFISVPLEPAQKNNAVHQSIWSPLDFPAIRNFSPLRPQSVSALSLGENDYAVVFSPDIHPELYEELIDKKNPISMEIKIPDAVGFSRAAFEVGPIVLDNSNPGQVAEVTPAMKNFVMIGANGRELSFMEIETGRNDSVANQAQIIEAFLNRSESSVILAWPDEKPRFFDSESSSQTKITSGKRLSHAALIIPEEDEPVIMAGGENLRLIPIVVSDGSNQQQGYGGPSAAFDGEISDKEPLDSFWVAPVKQSNNSTRNNWDENGMPWLEARFDRPSYIRLVDIHHIESCGFDEQFNLKSYRLLGRPSARDAWEELKVVNHNSPVKVERHRIISGKAYEAIRLEVIEPNFQPDGQAARLAECIIWGEPQVSE